MLAKQMQNQSKENISDLNPIWKPTSGLASPTSKEAITIPASPFSHSFKPQLKSYNPRILFKKDSQTVTPKIEHTSTLAEIKDIVMEPITS